MNKTIEFKGARCFYKTEGKGKTVMLVHGFMEEGSMWNVIEKALISKYKVIVPDLPGFGQSPMVNGRLTMEVYAECLNAICKQEKIKSFILLGHSMGGYIVLSFAEKHAALLSGFGLINSHCFEDTAQKKINRKKGNEFILKHGTKIFVRELYNIIFYPSFKKKNQKLVNGMITKAEMYSPDALIAANTAMMNRKNKEGVLKNARVPVLLISGKEDETVPFEYSLKQASLAPVTDFHLFAESKHMTIFEKKRQAQKIMSEFCERCYLKG